MKTTSTALRALREDGLAGIWIRLRHRDTETLAQWQHDRDVVLITAAMMRLTERQLNRIGFSHSTLALDVERLVARVTDEGRIGQEVLRIVEPRQDYAIAAE